MKQDDRPPTESSKVKTLDWMKEGFCLAYICGMEGHVCGTGHCLNTLSDLHCHLAKFYGRPSMPDKNKMELIADCAWSNGSERDDSFGILQRG